MTGKYASFIPLSFRLDPSCVSSHFSGIGGGMEEESDNKSVVGRFTLFYMTGNDRLI